MRTSLAGAALLVLLLGGVSAQAQTQSQSPAQSPAQTPAESQEQTRNASHSIAKIREYCAEWDEKDFSKVENPFLSGYCLGLVQAFRDGVALGTASTLAFLQEDKANGRRDKRTKYDRWCHPSGIPNQFLVGAFMDWSSRHPKHWDLPYSVGFYEAFREEWPCEKANIQPDTQPSSENAPKDNQK